MSQPSDPDTLGFLISDVARILRAEIERRIAAAGVAVTPGEGRALANVARCGIVRQNVLAERMGVEAMTLSGYLDRLESRGLVTRAADPADRRAKLVELTPQAEDVLADVRAIGAAIREDLTGIMGADRWNDLIGMLKALRTDLATLKGEAPRPGDPS
jgi:MarR family transcriptional regulator, transcriptional regulator for hemolysin